MTGNIDEDFDDEAALAELVAAGIFFISDTQDPFWEHPENKRTTITLSLNCNDVWYWGCADAEDVTTEDLPNLYCRFKESKRWGPLKWACVKRNLAPQVPIVSNMKKGGVWDEEMKALPLPAKS